MRGTTRRRAVAAGTAAESRILIVGGGIGGLTLAAALEQVGLPFALFERAPQLNDVGAGIQLAPNAVKSLREAGLGEDIMANGSLTESFEFWSEKGKRLSTTPVGEYGRRHGAPLVFISRPTLLRLLSSRVPPEAIVLGAPAESVAQDANGVTLRLADGREERGAALVAADGLRSTVRRSLLGEKPFRYGGYQDWRAAVRHTSDALPPATFRLFLGRGIRAGIGHAGDGLMFWYSTANSEAGKTKAEHGGKAGLLERLEGWPAPVEELIEATPEEAIDLADNYELRPLPHWADGRVALLGDAAHGITTNIGRGGSEAIEDAATLAYCLHKGVDMAAAFAEYEGIRRPAVEAVRKRAWQLGTMARLKNPAACAVRSTILRVMEKPVAKKLEADFAHEVPSLTA
jgi:2-polyprenyl-6-methoxyphenol hydroxylase-like FAD-dependent oxidoreductase